VRVLLRERKRPSASWWIGDSATPLDLEARLEQLGLVRPASEPPHEPQLTALALVEPPPEGPADVRTLRARTAEEFAAGSRSRRPPSA
jgi:hypothetical protein